MLKDSRKQKELIIASLLTGTFVFRLVCMIMTTITNITDTLTMIVISTMCIGTALFVIRVMIVGTIQESEDTADSKRIDYLYVMRWLAICGTWLLAVMMPIYWFNSDSFGLMGYSSLPCLFVTIAIGLYYHICYKEEIVALFNQK